MRTPLYVALFSASINLFIGVLILVRGTGKKLNLYFLGLVVMVACWALASGISNTVQNTETSELFSRLSFGLSVCVIGLAYIITVLLGSRRKSLQDRLTRISLLGIFIIAPLSSTSLVYTAPSLSEFYFGPFILVYAVFLTFSILAMLFELFHTFHVGSRESRSQSKLIVQGLVLTMICIAVFNLVLPSFSKSENSTVYSPLFSLIFVSCVAIAISKHKLFDFRAVLVRSLSYLFTTFFVVGGYVVVAFVIKRFILPESKVETSQLIPNIILTVVLVLTFPFLKREFDRITNKIFFRDAYDPQALIGKLNQTLVTNIQLDSLLTKSALVIQENIKNDFCTFYIRETSYFPSRIIGAHRKDPEFESIDDLETHASKIHHRVHSAENDSENDNEINLSKILKKNQIEVMARLVTTLDYDVKGIGYIFMGQKKSGGLYTSQDLKIIEIIANELVIAIENVLRFEEIEQFNVTLQKKIDAATKELKESNEKLKALDEAKDEFVSMASHQLRTPLTSIKGYISMVLEGDAGKISETQAKMLGQAFFSSQRMVYLISDLLNVSRLKTGKFVIESKPVYLPDIVESEIEQLIEGASSKNLTLSFTKPKEFPTMLLDEMKLRQVIMNFTDNAIYYTPSGGKINITLKDSPKSVEFIVKDSGIGVPKEQQHKLFVKFFRADNARKARPDGTGLGLFMAKKVIIAQGGSMIFDSVEGKGSTFGFSFPKEKLEVKQPETQK